MNKKLNHGYCVLGHRFSARIVVEDVEATLAEFLLADPFHYKGEGYLSQNAFGPELREHHRTNPTLPDFHSQTWASWLWFDLDRGDTREERAEALKDTQTLATCLVDDFGVDPRDMLVFFSGNKGFHAAIRTTTWNPAPDENFHVQAGLCAEFIAKKAGVKIDGIYDRMRILRLPNTVNPDGSLFKTPMTYDELMAWRIDDILERAKTTRTFIMPAPEGRTNPKMPKLWAKCVEMAAQKTAAVATLKTGPAKVFATTIDFIGGGAPAGTRNDCLYAAAANLSDFPDRDSLIVELLYDAAKRSGLSDGEILRTIKSALERTN